MRFHHVGVHVSDFEKSEPMYQAMMGTLGFENYDVPEHIATAWGTTTCSFRIVQPPIDKISASTSHICFDAPDEASVDKFYEVATKLGAKGLSERGEYVDWGHRHVSSMIQDFDGNCLEAVYVDPAEVKV